MWQVVGQTKALSLLQHSLERELLAHAYLVIGPPHVGKMTLALNLAQALNCQAPTPPCGECTHCKKIALAKHADVQIISVAHNGSSSEAKPRTEISINQIREMQHSSSLPPFEGKYKVFIIDGAECLSNEAANCLLKTLEEPADKIIFILLATNDKLLPDTVVSRCQRLELSPMTTDETEIVINRQWGFEQPKAKLIARLSHGCLGWAISAASDNKLLQQRAEKLDKILDTIESNYEKRFAYVGQLVTEFSQNREIVHETLNLWLNWWHDLLLVKTGNIDIITNLDFEHTLAEMSQSYNLAQIKTVINQIQMAEEQLRQNANPRLVLEVLMLNIPRRKHE